VTASQPVLDAFCATLYYSTSVTVTFRGFSPPAFCVSAYASSPCKGMEKFVVTLGFFRYDITPCANCANEHGVTNTKQNLQKKIPL